MNTHKAAALAGLTREEHERAYKEWRIQQKVAKELGKKYHQGKKQIWRTIGSDITVWDEWRDGVRRVKQELGL